MKAYILKCAENGIVYFLDRKGFIANDEYFHIERCYKTLKAAKIACTRRMTENRKNLALQEKQNANRIKNGKKPFVLYHEEFYAPIEVNAYGK